jgi:PAS domain S-box-containing protein
MVATAVIAFAGIGSLIAIQALDHARSSAREKATFQADLAAGAVDDALVLAQTTLAGMLPSFPAAQLVASPEKCQLLFAGVGPFSRAHLDVVLPDGQVICSSLAERAAPAGATHAGAAWLSSATAAPTLSAVFRDQLTGSDAVSVVAAVPGAETGPQVILAIVLDLPSLSGGLASTYGGPEGFTFTVRQGDATLSGAAGAPAGDQSTSARLGGSAPVTGAPWRVEAGMSEAKALESTQEILLKGSGLGLGALALLVLVLFLVNRQIARPLDRLAVTERKLRTSEERLRLLLQGARDYAIVMLDVDGNVVSWSASAQLLDGYAEEDALGTHFSAFFSEDDAAAGRPEEILHTAATTGRDENEGPRVRQDGSLYWARSVLTARRDAQGQLQGFVAVTYDATVRHEVELTITRMNGELEQRVHERTTQLELQAKELHTANAELQAFTYSVSHDLRAPLRSLNGFATLLTQECEGDPSDEAKEYAGRIARSAHTLTAMVDALLSLSATQRATFKPSTLDLTGLARSAWDELAPELDGRDVQLVLPALPPGQGDARLIRQVLANLLGNAVKYTRQQEHATIEVGSRVTPTSTVYFVRDNGAGFDMRYASGLFEVFKRLHRAEDFPGTGIGLASVKRIITRHGGRVWAESRPNQGATFYFTLGPTSEGLAESEDSDGSQEFDGSQESEDVEAVLAS